MFGASQPAASGFGAPAAGGFGAPATGGFGAPAAGAFGAPAAPAFGAASAPAFGAASGAFGAPAAAQPALGAATGGAFGGGAFGASTGGAFGAPAAGGSVSGAAKPATGSAGAAFGAFAEPAVTQAADENQECGMAVSETNAIYRPNGLAYLPEGDLVLADSWKRNVLRIDVRTGAQVWCVSSHRDGLEMFKCPVDVAVTAASEILVTDLHMHRVVVLNADGSLVRFFGREGTGPGEFKQPMGIACGPGGTVLVVDSGNGRVQVLDVGGACLRCVGGQGSGQGQLNGPVGVAVTAASHIVVCDRDNNRLVIFTWEGAFLRSVGPKLNLPNQRPDITFNDPQFVAVDAAGHVLVSDDVNGSACLQEFDEEYNFLKSRRVVYGHLAPAFGFFLHRARGVAVDAAGNIAVADIGGCCVLLLGTRLTQEITVAEKCLAADAQESAMRVMRSMSRKMTIVRWKRTISPDAGGDMILTPIGQLAAAAQPATAFSFGAASGAGPGFCASPTFIPLGGGGGFSFGGGSSAGSAPAGMSTPTFGQSASLGSGLNASPGAAFGGFGAAATASSAPAFGGGGSGFGGFAAATGGGSFLAAVGGVAASAPAFGGAASGATFGTTFSTPPPGSASMARRA